LTRRQIWPSATPTPGLPSRSTSPIRSEATPSDKPSVGSAQSMFWSHRGYKTFDGLAFPTRRRVYRRNRDGTPDRILAAITLDIDDITTI
jgi:hypothetical protein